MTRTIAVTILATMGAAMAAEMKIDDRIVTRNDILEGVVKLDAPTPAAGEAKLTWTDSYGRTVAVETVPVRAGASELPVKLPLGRAVAMQNFLSAEVTAGGRTAKVPRKEFIVTPASPVWDDYTIIMYYAYRDSQQDALRDVGITAGKLSSGGTQRTTGGKIWYSHNYRFYCDQISTFFYAAYHTPAQRPKNRLLHEAKKAYAADRTSKKPFYRQPCFHDPKALAEATRRLATAAKNQMRYRPFFYAHTDEGGVADLVAAWDFCFDPRTLAAFRKWLIGQYGSLAAINKEWGTDFNALDDVVPFSSDEMMARGGDNFSPWHDHRTFMNVTFANVLAAGTKAVESVDPTARVGLVGCQMPGAFGGYDYWLLSRVMTAIEPYNIGNNREIWRSFAPEKPAVTTAFGFGDMEVWRLWYQMLHGDQGIIIYDEKYRYLVGRTTTPSKLGAAIAPTYKELTGGICKQLRNMERVNDPVAIHYSHPSITAHWMYEVRPEGKNWIRRGSAAERKTSDFLRLRETATKLIEDNQLQYKFVAYAQLEDGEFDKMDTKVLILPQSIAMSKAECDAVRRFVQRGGTVVADCRTALMDEHGKMLANGQLDDLFGIERRDMTFKPGKAGLKLNSKLLFSDIPHWVAAGELRRLPAAEPGVRPTGKAVAYYEDAAGTPAVIVNQAGEGRAIYLNAVITDYHRWRLRPPEGAALRKFFEVVFQQAGVKPQYGIARSGGGDCHGVEVHPYVSGKLRILGLHRNYQLRVSELGPPEYRKQDALAEPMEIDVDLGARSAVYNQRTGEYLGSRRNVTVDLPEHKPVILAVLPGKVQGMAITAPTSAKRGSLVKASLKLDAPAVGDRHTFRVKVAGPDGKELRMLTQTLLAPKGKAVWELPIAASDPAGEYTLEARDVATGVKATRKLVVR